MQTTISAEMLSLMMDGHVACRHPHEITECSFEVVALSTTQCRGQLPVCLSIFEHQKSRLSLNPMGLCETCYRAKREVVIAECWQIRPI